jgi:FkbM family methyltransferase
MFQKLATIVLPAPYLRLKHCRHGVMLYDTRDEHIGAALDRYGEFAELEAQLFSGLIKPGMMVVEVGANIGAHSVHLAKLVGEDGGLVAFEPRRVMYQMLCANLALNGIQNTDAQCIAIGATRGEVAVPQAKYRSSTGPGSTASSASEDEIVDIITIDNLALPACHMIKIGAAGSEKQVLDGASNTIARFRPFLYVANEVPERHAELVATLIDLGYRMWWHKPWLFNPGNLAGEGENLFPDAVSFNMICLPREGAPDEILGGFEIRSPDEPHPSGGLI